jgi:hypothetical protein
MPACVGMTGKMAMVRLLPVLTSLSDAERHYPRRVSCSPPLSNPLKIYPPVNASFRSAFGICVELRRPGRRSFLVPREVHDQRNPSFWILTQSVYLYNAEFF